MTESKEDEFTEFKNEIHTLKQKIKSMKDESESKQKAIADLARDKEKLSLELKKQIRTQINLKQQLEEERSFYRKEKERYCHEMNEVKKAKRHENKKNVKLDEKSKDNKISEEENEKLKSALKETLQANYNLSIKFLRMKNTKFCIKNRFKKLQTEHEKILSQLKAQVEKSQDDIENFISHQMQLHASPSHKKYLQIMKTNSQLLHENLNLQAQIDQMSQDLGTMKIAQVKQETYSKLKYISAHSSASGGNNNSRKSTAKREKESQTDIRLTDEILISEFLSTKLTNNLSRSSKCSLPSTAGEAEAESEKYVLLPAMEGQREIFRTQSAPGIVQRSNAQSDEPCFVCAKDSSTNT